MMINSIQRRSSQIELSFRRIARLSFLPLLAFAVGCQQPRNTINQIDPYAGKKPEPIAELPVPSGPEPPPKKGKFPTGGESGWVPSGGISNRWECVVVHHSDSDKSTPEGMRAWHLQRGWDALGYHFVIGNGVGYPDGQVYIGERWKKQMHGAHCKVPGNYYNEHGVGICLIGNLDAHPPTKKQMQALTRLASFLTSKCGIPQSKVLTHGGITHKTACPGRYFSLQSLRGRLTEVSLGEEQGE